MRDPEEVRGGSPGSKTPGGGRCLPPDPRGVAEATYRSPLRLELYDPSRGRDPNVAVHGVFDHGLPSWAPLASRVGRLKARPAPSKRTPTRRPSSPCGPPPVPV